MKKRNILLALLLLGISAGGYAQKLDKNKIVLLVTTKKLDDAKTEIDKVLADPKNANSPEALALKTRVYGEIVNDSTLKTKYPDAADQTFDAFQSFLKAEPDTAKANALLKDPTISGINGISYIYSDAFNKGKDAFGASNWPEAFHDFARAQKIGQFLVENGYITGGSKTGIDTLSTLYTGFAAQNAAAKDAAYSDSAVYYYNILASRGIATAEAAPAYQFLINYYIEKKDKENADKALAIAQKAYPQNKEVWDQLASSELTASASPDELIQKYTSQAPGLNETQLIAFAEAIAAEKANTKDSLMESKLNEAAIDAYKRAFAFTPNGIYAYNAGVLLYNKFAGLEDQFFAAKGVTPALKAKRADIEKEEFPLADSTLEWLTKGYDILKAKTDRNRSESISLNRSVDFIANLYAWKRDKARGRRPADVDKFDAQFKKFDAEHDKYKQ